MVTATISGQSIGEEETGYNTGVFTVSLSEVLSETISVPWRIMGGSVSAETDLYSGSSYSSGVLTFRAGDTLEEVRFYPFGESLVEADEAIVFQLLPNLDIDFGGGNYVQSAVGWVIDEDGSGDKTAIAVSSPIVEEGRAAVFDLVLSRPADRDLTIPWSLAGSAEAGTDYTDAVGVITIPRGQSTASVRVNLLDDRAVESLEYLQLQLELPGGIVEASGGLATIVDNDSSRGPVVLVAADATGEVDSGYNDMTFSVMLTEAAATTVTVPWRLGAQGTGTAGTDFYSGGSYSTGTVTFSPGETHKTVRGYVYGDTIAEHDESVVFEVLTPTGATLPGNANSISAAGWIRDNEPLSTSLALQILDADVVEGGAGETATASFMLTLSEAPTEDLELQWRAVSGGAAAGPDFSRSSGTVTFLEGQTTAAVGVEVRGDGRIEGNEDFRLQVFAPREIAVIGGGTGTIIDDDSGPWERSGNGRDNKFAGYGLVDWIKGRGGNDEIDGKGGNDRLWGNNGRDRIDGGNGRDEISGGRGADVLTGGAGGDGIEGGGGRDRIQGESGNDDLGGGGGDDRIEGGGGGEVLRGGGGADRLDGGRGRDRIEGGGGSDVIEGGGGRDVFLFSRGDGRDRILDFERGEVIVLEDVGRGSVDLSRRGGDAIVDYDGGRIVIEDVSRRAFDVDDILYT